MPLALGVQRFGASSGAPVEQSSTAAGVSGSMGWANGQLGLAGGGEAADGSRRRLADELAEDLHAFNRRHGKRLHRRLHEYRHHMREYPQHAHRRLREFAKRWTPWMWTDDEAELGWGSWNATAGRRRAQDTYYYTYDEATESGMGTGSGEGSGPDAAIEDDFVNTTLGDNATDLSGEEVLGPPEGLGDLLDSLVTFFIAVPFVFLLQMFTIWHWRYRMNRAYYAELLLPPPEEEPEEHMLGKPKLGKRRWWCCGRRAKVRTKKKKARFIAYPGVFVFPSLLVLAINFFLTGLIEGSVSLIIECTGYPDDEVAGCLAPGVPILFFAAIFLAYCFSSILHFNVNFRESPPRANRHLPPHRSTRHDTPHPRAQSTLSADRSARCHLRRLTILGTARLARSLQRH